MPGVKKLTALRQRVRQPRDGGCRMPERGRAGAGRHNFAIALEHHAKQEQVELLDGHDPVAEDAPRAAAVVGHGVNEFDPPVFDAAAMI